ncbi:MAG: hypothetical protein EOO59_01305 [Hymenobacter sp.]|nr:MAG: hypothetical protein EOO59_01305 [Hymenobacter sp.]
MPSLFALHYSREHRFLFAYLLLATLALAGVAGWVLYHSYDFPSVNAVAMSNKIKRQQRLFEEQKRYVPLLDSAHHEVATYRPEVTAVFLEADIDNQLSDIRRLYTANDTVVFFRAFDQAANFYQMLYRDKKILANQKANCRLFAGQLESCTVGFQAKAPAGTVSATVAPAAPLPLSR